VLIILLDEDPSVCKHPIAKSEKTNDPSLVTMNEKSPESVAGGEDLDFRHCLRDTIILLGGRKEIADLLIKSMDGISEADIRKLRNYNTSLFTETKRRLNDLNRLTVRVG